MKRLQMALLAAAIASLSWTAANAEGAVAIGKPANVARNGVAIGLSTDFPSAKAAAADALAQCKKSDAKASTRALCKIVKSFKGQCAAVAFDPRPGTPGFGWAVAATKSQARAASVVSCNKAGGVTTCQAVGADCD